MLLSNLSIFSVLAIIVAYILNNVYKKWYWAFIVPGSSLFQWDISGSGDMKKLFEWKQNFGQRMVKSYGRLYRICLNRNPVLIIADPKYVQDVCPGTAIHDSGLGLGKYFERHLGDCMGCLNGKKWTRLRTIFRPAMSLQATTDSASVMQKVLDEWDEKTVKPLSIQEEPVNVTDLVGQLPMKTMAVVCFGYDFVTQHQEEIDNMQRLSNSIMNTCFSNKWAACLPFYEYFNTKANEDLRIFKRQWMSFLEAYMTSKEREEGRGGVFDHVAAMALNSSQSVLTSTEILNTLKEIIFANQDVAIPSYSWMFSHLAVYPEIAANIASQQSTKNVKNKDTEENINEQPYITSKSMLENTYPEILNFLNESARVNPLAMLTTQAILDRQLKIGEHMFSPGTRVSVDHYSLNHHPKYWDKPELFDPSRFRQLDEYTKKWCFSRFGAGVRICPGQHYANLGMGNALLRLLLKYEIVPEGNTNNNSIIAHHTDIPVDPGEGFITPKLKIHLRVRPIYLNGSTPDLLHTQSVYAMISVLQLPPLIKPNGARQLVKFLSTLPQPSTILLIDSLSRHNINAFAIKTNSESDDQDIKCKEISIERTQVYWIAIKSELDAIKDEDVRKKIKLLRLDDTQDNRYAAQVKILEKHYQTNPTLREKIDLCAKGLVRRHLPKGKYDSDEQIRQLVVKYITQELPILVTGHVWKGIHYSLLVYPTAGENEATVSGPVIKIADNDKPTIMDLARDIKDIGLFRGLRDELVEACGGYEATAGNIILPLSAP